MAKATVGFYKCLLNEQKIRSDSEHMSSQVFFFFEYQGKKYKNLSATIKQAVGSKFEEYPIEVGFPSGLEGSFNYDVFRDVAEKYYRSKIGSIGTVVRQTGAKNTLLQNLEIIEKNPVMFEVEISESNKGW
jgi:hypothetical protein